jgi:hypothetical protein
MLDYTGKAKYQVASTSEIHNFWSVSADQTRATRRDFGDMPMIFLSHVPYKPATAQELQDKRTLVVEQMHNEVAAMSTHGVNPCDLESVTEDASPTVFIRNSSP